MAERTGKRLLAFGAGVDSTALLASYLDPVGAAAASGTPYSRIVDTILGRRVDAVVFADPGSEFPETYRNVETAARLCGEAGIRFERVVLRDRHGRRLTIQDWLLSNGTIPVMAGGSHVCSLKFKGQVMQRFAAAAFPDAPIEWLVCIEADETRRTSRFRPDRSARQTFAYPLQEIGWDRDTCARVIAACWPHPVRKSSCTFCPFMQEHEILEVATDHPEHWALVEQIEERFAATSAVKHARWLEAGRPRTKRGHAPVGMWSRNSWAEGRRLFVKQIDGRQLSADEWFARAVDNIDSPEQEAA